MNDLPPPPDKQATIWARLVARLVDLNLYNTLLTFPIDRGMKALAAFLHIPYTPTDMTTLGIIEGLTTGLLLVFPLSMLLDSLICARFGNTLGKYLLGIRPATANGDRLNLSTCLRRNYLIYVGCFTGGIFILTPLAEIFHYIRFRNTGTTFWDEEEGTVVLSPKGSGIRTVIMFILWLLIPDPIPLALLPH